MCAYFLLLFSFTSFLVSSYSTDPNRPNILFILGDDFGWADVGYNGGTDAVTPNLNKYAREGLTLNKYYSQYCCTPGRAALLTGKYPIHLGMQHSILYPSHVFGLPLKYKLLPETLKSYGYNTFMVGKWHLGFVTNEYLPTNRGFDEFVGFYLGGEDYFTKVEMDHVTMFKINNEAINNTEYSTDIYTHAIKKILYKDVLSVNHKSDKPFFIYGSYQAIHNPYMAPKGYENLDIFNKSKNINRKRKMIHGYLFDKAFGEILDYVKNVLNIWDNTLVIFSSDNGGQTRHYHSNYPLRGNKETNFEGGHRVPAFINGGYLNDNNKYKVSNDLFHITDWYPTILSLISNQNYDSFDFDGIDQSEIITKNHNFKDTTRPIRDEILLNIDSFNCSHPILCGAIIYKNWKLVIGDYVTFNNEYDSGWTKLPNQRKLIPSKINCNFKYNSNNISIINFTDYMSLDICPFNGNGCLFNLDSDPCEYNDLSSKYPKMYNLLLKKLKKYNNSMEMSLHQKYVNLNTNFSIINNSNPKLYNGFWSPWIDIKTHKKLLNPNYNKYNNEKIKNINDNSWYSKWNFLISLL